MLLKVLNGSLAGIIAKLTAKGTFSIGQLDSVRERRDAALGTSSLSIQIPLLDVARAAQCAAAPR